jgi:hypothetical protein
VLHPRRFERTSLLDNALHAERLGAKVENNAETMSGCRQIMMDLRNVIGIDRADCLFRKIRVIRG